VERFTGRYTAFADDSRHEDHDLSKADVHHVPTGYAALRDAGVDFDSVDYYTDPIPKAKLKELLRKMGIPARELLRTKEERFKALRLGERELSDDELIDVMVANPDLIQRPIIEKGTRAILARPAERLQEIL
jgi:arsenate reductase (glutaredoxin)